MPDFDRIVTYSRVETRTVPNTDLDPFTRRYRHGGDPTPRNGVPAGRIVVGSGEYELITALTEQANITRLFMSVEDEDNVLLPLYFPSNQIYR